MADLSVSNSDTQRNLEDLKQEHEQKLRNLRADFQKRESQEQESGSATVNHIKKVNEDRLGHVEKDGDSKVKQESDRIAKEYADLKRRVANQSENLQTKSANAEQQSEKNISNAKKEEYFALKQTQDEAKTFVESQKERQAQARDDINQNLGKTIRKGNEEIAQAKTEGHEQKLKAESDSRKNLDNLRSQEEQLYSQTHKEGEQRVERQKSIEAQKVDTDRTEKSHSLHDTNRKYQAALTSEQREGEQRLSELQKQNAEKLRQSREISLRTNEETQTEYSAESQRIQKEGESDVHERQDKFTALKKQQETTNKTELKALSSQLTDQENKVNKEAMNKGQVDAQKREQVLREKRTQFDSQYQVAEKANKDSLSNQKEIYLQALYKQKQKYDAKFDKESTRSEDPFYQVKTFQPNLTEQRNAYVLKAKVPAHEKDSVAIIVKDDRITLSAKRNYDESLPDASGGRTTTNSYQTYRTELKLGVPVAAEKAFRKVDDDGTITVIVPKKGSPPGSQV